MLNEIWKLSHVQVGQNYERSKSSNVTHYRDGTTKIGRHYEGSQISTQSGCFSLEIGEKLGGSTKTKNFKETFNQIAINFESSSNDITKNNVAGKFIANIKKGNVRYMVVVETKLNDMIREYRFKCLQYFMFNYDVLPKNKNKLLLGLLLTILVWFAYYPRNYCYTYKVVVPNILVSL